MAEEAARISVLAGSAAAETKEKMKVLVAVDGSEGGLYALRWAIDHLCGGGDGVGAVVVLSVMHVQQPFQHYMFTAGPGPGPDPTPDVKVADTVRKGQEKNTEGVLSQVMKICAEKRVTAETLVMDGDPKEMICQAAEKMGADLVVVGSRGLSTIKRAFLGSVSNYVAHHAPCPVLIAKPKKQTREKVAPPHA